MPVFFLAVSVLAFAWAGVYPFYIRWLQGWARKRIPALEAEGPLSPQEEEKIRAKYSLRYQLKGAIQFRVNQARDEKGRRAAWLLELSELRALARPEPLEDARAIAKNICPVAFAIGLIALLVLLGPSGQ